MPHLIVRAGASSELSHPSDSVLLLRRLEVGYRTLSLRMRPTNHCADRLFKRKEIGSRATRDGNRIEHFVNERSTVGLIYNGKLDISRTGIDGPLEIVVDVVIAGRIDSTDGVASGWRRSNPSTEATCDAIVGGFPVATEGVDVGNLKVSTTGVDQVEAILRSVGSSIAGITGTPVRTTRTGRSGAANEYEEGNKCDGCKKKSRLVHE